MLAEAHRQAGQEREGLRILTEALTVVQKTKERYYEAELHRLKGELTLQLGARGWGLETSPSSPQSLSLKPQVPREVAQEAERYLLKAIEIAQHQQAKSWELRATISLARLWQQQATQPASRPTQHKTRAKLNAARTMLAEVYHWFTEGFATKDLQEAKMLLEVLRLGP